MNNGNKKKKFPMRIVVFIISVLVIIFMWVKKDIAAVYSTVSSEQGTPLIVTTVAVSFLKVAAIAAAVFFVKWIFGKMKSKK